ncbi:putative pre-16S rRNA nuclease [Chitiniphilus shinanonensis]|uniref:Putative pre-16S rRNA nuclease n=1 Tax=Chitiniphilus shinanonensis TaxID=553088 RepID=A0ABQ6BWH7_9NEIS|nr:Holliday junction resolvase RuvX [Chitiniphilus shinanonensis]GLS05686.1 putative pre-16S rRNA nuclease [Chitiniphilus shinanonensis]
MSSVLAFDFGAARIGVAVGNTELGIAHPVETISAEGNDARFARIAQLIADWQPTQLVVGLPLTEDGAEQETSRLARKFANRLHGRFALPVILVDERYSSAAASMALADGGLRGRRQKPALDQVAAMQILQGWFDGAPAHD